MAVVDNRVFVKDVPFAATLEDLTVYFSQFGATSDVYMPRQFGTDQHKGICFVTYCSSDSVQMVLAQPGHTIQGQTMQVDMCLSKDKGKGKDGGKAAMPGSSGTINGDRLFITKVPPEATREEVETLFAKFGQWTDFFLPNGHFPGGHKGICFVSYSDAQSAQLAISCGPHQIRGQDLVVEMATPRDGAKGGGKKGDMQYQQQQQWAPMVQQQQQQQQMGGWPQAQQAWGGYPQQTTPAMGQVVMPPVAMGQVGLKPGRLFLTKVAEDVTKEDLTVYFQQFGELQDVYVPVGKSIAFVSFVDANTASVVVANPEHEVKVGRIVKCDLAYDRPPLEAKGKGKFRYQPYG